jgi:anti-anti-sigma factor
MDSRNSAKHHRTRRVVRRKLFGELDLAAVEAVRETFRDVVAARPAVLELDLAEVTFIECVALSELVFVRNIVTDAGGHVVITRAAPAVRRLLNLTQLTDVFGLIDTGEGDSVVCPRSEGQRLDDIVESADC